MNDIHEKYADDGLVILTVNLYKERSEAARFLEQNKVEMALTTDALETATDDHIYFSKEASCGGVASMVAAAAAIWGRS